MDEVETIRLEQFRQLKKEIRGSERHLIVGIDVAKDKHHAFFGTATGKTLLKRLPPDSYLQIETYKIPWFRERGHVLFRGATHLE